MGDKQDYLKAAIPDLINRLINPNCVDANGDGPRPVTVGASTNGVCASGRGQARVPTRARPAPWHRQLVARRARRRRVQPGGDGARRRSSNVLGAQRRPGAPLEPRSLTYAAGGSTGHRGRRRRCAQRRGSRPVPLLVPVTEPPTRRPDARQGQRLGRPLRSTQLITDFADMVGGTGVFGCGIESQLESWYRFLVQPDPYESITHHEGNSGGNRARRRGRASTRAILQQRHDFLRPDSLVAIIVVLSDENDSGDRRAGRSAAQGGQRWMADDLQPAANGTSALQHESLPRSPACTVVRAAGSNGSDRLELHDEGRRTPQVNDWGYDLNLRHVHMKARSTASTRSTRSSAT